MADESTDRLFENIEGFEWDDNKRRANVAKHGIDFEQAKDAFADPHSYVVQSSASAAEPRFVIVGALQKIVAAVIFTRRGSKIRIISARAARRSERERYGSRDSESE